MKIGNWEYTVTRGDIKALALFVGAQTILCMISALFIMGVMLSPDNSASDMCFMFAGILCEYSIATAVVLVFAQLVRDTS